jgi:RHS repeat-associated protein
MNHRMIVLVATIGASSAHTALAEKTVTYYYTDHLGSVLAEADAAGNVTRSTDYRPYGSQAVEESLLGVGFSGHVTDSESGLSYMQGRYYDPLVGRFLSTDPAPIKAGSPFTVARFSYANANPLSNIDPDGRVVVSANSANNTQLAEMINSRAAGQFAFRDNRLVRVGAGATAGKSAYYANLLVTAINSSRTLTLNISPTHTGTSGTVYNVNAAGGGGITESRNGDAVTTISGDPNFLQDGNGGLLAYDAADILLHEVVGHGLAALGYPDTGNAVEDENKARKEMNQTERKAEPDHTETDAPPPPKAPCATAGSCP